MRGLDHERVQRRRPDRGGRAVDLSRSQEAERLTIETVLIVGAGPGGLAAAIALARLGVAVQIVEIEPELTAAGVAVNVQNAPLRALATLGVIDDVVRRGHSTATVHLLDADGVPVAPPLRPAPLVPGYPASVEVRRMDVARILEAAALRAGAAIRYGASVTALEDDGSRVQATFTDGSRGGYDLVIGADGIHSRVRDLVFGPQDDLLEYSGQCIWRAEAERGDIDELMMLSGPAGKLGLLPLTDERMYVYLLKDFASPPARGELGDVDAALRTALSDFRGPAAGVAERLLPGADFRGLHSLLMPAPWFRGRVVLIGDAAHATTPHLAYGLGLAVEDGLVLAESLERADDLDGALTEFMRRRDDRCRLVVENSRRLSAWEQRPPADPAAPGRLMSESMTILTSLP
ncbi:MAG: FAD-dependent monooxygenase [Microbacterium sp.]|uniref:FAD-dependent monooxygenase n=1 Tax=Microbacterium sp. TaxID=51671 RepID=UPI0039E60635